MRHTSLGPSTPLPQMTLCTLSYRPTYTNRWCLTEIEIFYFAFMALHDHVSCECGGVPTRIFGLQPGAPNGVPVQHVAYRIIYNLLCCLQLMMSPMFQMSSLSVT